MIQKIIVQGKAEGIILKSKSPINFLGAVEKNTGIITDNTYEIFQKTIKDSILVFPHGIGSSVGAYTIYSLKASNSAPKAMLCTKTDLTVASGCALANIPLVIVDEEFFNSLESGKKISLDTTLNLIS